MRLNQSSIWATLLAGGLLFVGCATDQTAYLPKFKPVQPVEVAPTRDAEELERRIQAMAHFGAGVSYELRGEQAKAQEEFYQAAMADSTNEPVVVEVARRLIRQKDSDRAISLLIQATGNSKASANLYALLGVAYAQAGKQELAILASDSALQKNPKLPQAYQNLIQIYLQNERLPEALKVLAKASQQKGGDAGFYTSLAELYLAITRAHPTEMDRLHPRILTLLAEAKRLNTDSAAVLQRMGEAFRSLGEFAQAAEAYARMQVLFPGNPQVRERLTELYLQSGNRKKAAELIEELLRDFPANPQGNYLLGLIAAAGKQGGPQALHQHLGIEANRLTALHQGEIREVFRRHPPHLVGARATGQIDLFAALIAVEGDRAIRRKARHDLAKHLGGQGDGATGLNGGGQAGLVAEAEIEAGEAEPAGAGVGREQDIGQDWMGRATGHGAADQLQAGAEFSLGANQLHGPAQGAPHASTGPAQAQRFGLSASRPFF